MYPLTGKSGKVRRLITMVTTKVGGGGGGGRAGMCKGVSTYWEVRECQKTHNHGYY